MKFLCYGLFLVSAWTWPYELEPVKDDRLSFILSTFEVLYDYKGTPFVRIVESQEEINECGGTVVSCPNSRLFIILSMGDLGDVPRLYELPKAKGWKIQSVEIEELTLKIEVVTTLSHSNIAPEERAAWESKTYRLSIYPVGIKVNEGA